MAIQSSEVVFFLGAGASVKAGVPATYSFVEEYVKSIKEPAKKDTIIKIVNTLKQWKKDEIDVELLLETLTKLKDKDREPLLPFYPGGSFILEGKEPLINDLKDFIKSKAIVVSEERIRYLEPFRELIEELRPLDIISVNYDTSIEQFCNCYRLTYEDGFDVYWNPTVFQKEHTDIRLYKIHGSVMWYQSDRGGYIKLPVMVRENTVKLITGEKAENLMLYPMQKWDYTEPLLELLVEIKHLLESESCKYLIVVGYSFRDDHITRILWDVARKNRALHFLLIDPNAYQIYSNKLKYYDTSEKIPSSMDGRVICLPYLFEKVFLHIKNHYLKKIKEGFAYETAQHRIENQGEKANWISCLQSFADAEYTEKIETIVKKEPIDVEIYWPIKLEISLKMAVNLIANGEKEKGTNYFRDFCNFLKKVAVEGINANLVFAQSRGDRIQGTLQDYQIELKFNYRSTSNDIRAPFKETIENLSKFCETRAGFSKSGDTLQKISEKLKKVKFYLELFKDGKIGFEEYINLRESEIRDIEIFRNEYKMLHEAGPLSKQPLSEQQQHLEANIVEVERSILKGIIEEE